MPTSGFAGIQRRSLCTDARPRIVRDRDCGVREFGGLYASAGQRFLEQLGITGMVSDRCGRILELVPGQDANDSFVSADDAFRDEFLDSGDACRAGRFATEPARADPSFRVEDLLIRHFSHDAVANFERTQAFHQVDRAIDLDRAGDR